VKGRYKKRWRDALPAFPAKSMFNQMKARHMLWVEKYPNKGQNRGWPLCNIENARPEIKKACGPRIDADDLPFDPNDVIRNMSEFDNVDAGWGVSGN